MGVYLDSADSNVPKLRAWCVGRLENLSGVGGWLNLDDDSGRFAGFLAPEAPKKISEEGIIIKPGLEQVLEIGKTYVPSVVQEKFKEEIRKLYQ